jgi:integrase
MGRSEKSARKVRKYRRGESSDDQYGVELFRRALVQHDPLAWEAVQQCFNETMLHWIRAHPYRMSACRFDSEENYVVQAWTRLWMASIGQRGLAFGTLTAVLRYLRASLNGAILDTLQAYARPKEIPLSAPGDPEELFAEDLDEGREIWESIRSLLPDEREQRLAYLLFHCGLKPREIVRLRPQEFHNVQDIYRLRRNITEQLLRNVDRLRWQLRAFPKII